MIELVIAISVSAIITVVLAEIISRPIVAYANLSLRAQLTDSATLAMRHMRKEISQSLPNSVRVGCSGECIEFLHVKDKGIYRALAPGNFLSFDPLALDRDFESIGGLIDLSGIRIGINSTDCINNLADCLVINNRGVLGYNGYAHNTLATILGVSLVSNTIDFAFNTSQLIFPILPLLPVSSLLDQTFYIVDTPTSFICNTGSDETLRRYRGYPILLNQTSVDSHAELLAFAGTTTDLVVNQVTRCKFQYTPGSIIDSGLVTVELEISETDLPSGHTESITLVEQIIVGGLL